MYMVMKIVYDMINCLTKTCQGQDCAPAGTRGAPLGLQPCQEAQVKLKKFRHARSSARYSASEARKRVESCALHQLAPGEDALVAARKTVQMVRAAREQAARHKHETMEVML